MDNKSNIILQHKYIKKMEEKEAKKMKKQKCVQSLCNIITINEDNNNIKNKIKKGMQIKIMLKYLSEMKYKTRANGENKFEAKNHKGRGEEKVTEENVKTLLKGGCFISWLEQV